MIGYVTWSSMMSGLRSQRERIITWVSLRSGVASSGRWNMAHVPQMQAAATKAKMRNLFRTENPMTRLVILAPRSGNGGAPYPGVRVFVGILVKLALALVRAKNKGLVAVALRMSGGQSLLAIHRHSAHRIECHADFMRIGSMGCCRIMFFIHSLERSRLHAAFRVDQEIPRCNNPIALRQPTLYGNPAAEGRPKFDRSRLENPVAGFHIDDFLHPAVEDRLGGNRNAGGRWSAELDIHEHVGTKQQARIVGLKAQL